MQLTHLSVERRLLVILDQLHKTLELRSSDDKQTALLLYQAVFYLRDGKHCGLKATKSKINRWVG